MRDAPFHEHRYQNDRQKRIAKTRLSADWETCERRIGGGEGNNSRGIRVGGGEEEHRRGKSASPEQELGWSDIYCFAVK